MSEQLLAEQTDFLPTDYILPDASRQYFKPQPGDNPIRVLSSPILGYIVFTDENKPVRKRFEEGDFTNEELETVSAKKDNSGHFEGGKHFWSIIIWNNTEDRPQVWEVTQISILKKLNTLAKDPDWGDLRKFDLNINRTGSGKNDTDYDVISKPHKPIPKKVIETITGIEERGELDLEALWEAKPMFTSYKF